MGLLLAWADLEPVIPQVTATMRRYLTQIGCVLRPRSVDNADMALRSFAGFLTEVALTLRYAKIASRTVADEYFAVTDKVDALYGQPPVLPGDAIGPKMAQLRREHHRMLGNG